MRLASTSLLAFAIACSNNNSTDGPDGGASATGWPVEVAVIAGGQRVGATVCFQAADSTVLAVAHTDASGLADADMVPAGSSPSSRR